MNIEDLRIGDVVGLSDREGKFKIVALLTPEYMAYEFGFADYAVVTKCMSGGDFGLYVYAETHEIIK